MCLSKDETVDHLEEISASDFDFNETKVLEECKRICDLLEPTKREYFGVRKVFKHSYKCKCVGVRMDGVTGTERFIKNQVFTLYII